MGKRRGLTGGPRFESRRRLRIFSTSFQNFADTQVAFCIQKKKTISGLSARMVYPSKNMGVFVVVALEN